MSYQASKRLAAQLEPPSKSPRLTALQRKALVAALDQRVSEVNRPESPLPQEFPAVTLRSLQGRGFLAPWEGPRYMPQYYLTDSGRLLAEYLANGNRCPGHLETAGAFKGSTRYCKGVCD